MTATAVIEDVAPLRDSGFGWPLTGIDPGDWTYAPGYLDVRTEAQRAAEEAAWALDNQRYQAPMRAALPSEHPCSTDFILARWDLGEEVHAIVVGGLAPSPEVAVALARRHLDSYDLWMRNMAPERGAYLAGLVLDGYATTHPDYTWSAV